MVTRRGFLGRVAALAGAAAVPAGELVQAAPEVIVFHDPSPMTTALKMLNEAEARRVAEPRLEFGKTVHFPYDRVIKNTGVGRHLTFVMPDGKPYRVPLYEEG